MPKLTAKYSQALAAARQHNILSWQGQDQEWLYSQLREAGFMWDSKIKEWIELSEEPADQPTPFLMVRVWSDADVVQEGADMVCECLKKRKFRLIERSDVYPCRPPKQLEARIYLKFEPPAKKK